MSRLLVCLALAVSLSGCRDGTGPVDPFAPTGQLQFEFQGEEVGGAFAASGRMDLRSFAYGTWAAAMIDPDGIDIVALRAQQEWKADMVGIFLPGVSGTGSWTLGSGCQPPATACRDGELILGFDYRSALGSPSAPAPDAHFLIREGTLTIDFNDGARIRGRFSGTGVRDHPVERWTITIENGSFDLPLVPRS
jgi:hypothetical protein